MLITKITIKEFSLNEIFSSASISWGIGSHPSFSVNAGLDAQTEKHYDLLEKMQSYIGETILFDVRKEKNLAGDEKSGDELKFIGHVNTVNVTYRGGAPFLTIGGTWPGIGLEQFPNTISFTEKKLKDIVDKVSEGGKGISPFSFKNNPEYKSPIPYKVQYNETNFYFLKRLAAEYGEWFYYNGEDIIFGKPEEGAETELHLGSQWLTQFGIGMKTYPLSQTHIAYDYISGETHSEDSPGGFSFSDYGKYGSETLKKSKDLFAGGGQVLMSKEFEKSQDLKSFVENKTAILGVSAEVFSGRSTYLGLKPGSKIKIFFSPRDTKTGLEYRVISVNHQFDGGGNYSNQFQAIPAKIKHPPTPFIPVPGSGVQTAKVKENDDPDGMGRIKVQFTWQSGSEMSPWIRLSTALPGADMGSFIVPEKGEEVLVAFMQNHPERPYVLGGLYTGNNKPSGDFKNKDNNIKGLSTKGGNVLYLNDEKGKQEIKISNDGGSLLISAKGPVKLKFETDGDIEMNGNNISLKANKTINIEATNEVNVDGSDVNVNGKKGVSLNGSAQITLEGGTGKLSTSGPLEVSSSAITTVKGSVIKLN